MKRITLIGLVVVLLVGAGLTFAWLDQQDGKLVMQTPAAIAQEDASSTRTPTDSTDTALNAIITDSGQAAIKNAIAIASPAVVRVDVTGTVDVSDTYSDLLSDPFFRRFFGAPDDDSKQRETSSVGSGFVVSFDGEKYVVTNQHVIDDADTITVSNIDGEEWAATVIGQDDVLDVAVLQLEGDVSSLPTVTLGDSDTLELGDWAIAIGTPLGLSHTVTLGIISSINRDIEKPSGVGVYSDLIQTDAAINPGNSGGPLVNAYGEVIGINTMIARSTSSGVSVEGINFALSINGVTDILARLIEDGSVQRGWLGVQHAEITAAVADAYGLDPDQEGTLVVTVFPGDPAALAGIQEGDVIIQIGDTPIEVSDDLNDTIGNLPAGSNVDITVVRDGKTVTVTATLGLRPSEDELADYQGSAQSSTTEAALGITVESITSIVARHLGLNSTDGVVIMDIESGSRAEEAGLAVGDVILEVNHEEVASVDDWESIISSVGATDSVILTVYRSGQLGFITVE